VPEFQSRARRALAARWRELTPDAPRHEGGAHALRFEDALVPTLGDEDVRWAHDALAARAKGELRPSRSGTVQAHAAWSSTALVASAFAPWRHRPGDLPLAGLGPFRAVRLEERLHIPHGGGTPNLDVALTRSGEVPGTSGLTRSGEVPGTSGGLVGIESKLVEHLAPVRARSWKPAYRRPAMAAALEGGWAATFADLLEGRWAPRHLDAGQLVRHALSLRGSGDLVLVFWEPADADEHPEVVLHRREVAELLERVGDAAPRLHALPWHDLFAAWDPVAPAHAAALRDRYAVTMAA
jgi:hypothetical protein